MKTYKVKPAPDSNKTKQVIQELAELEGHVNTKPTRVQSTVPYLQHLRSEVNMLELESGLRIPNGILVIIIRELISTLPNNYSVEGSKTEVIIRRNQ